MSRAKNPKARRALQRQREVINDLIAAGYTLPHAQRAARMWHPTPAQSNLVNARKVRKEKNGGR